MNGLQGQRTARRAAPGAVQVAAIIAGRSLFFGTAIWIVVPPVSAATVAEGSLCAVLPMLLCWQFRGLAPRIDWPAALCFALANTATAILFARFLLIAVGLPGR